MKKTLIALFSLAGVVAGATYPEDGTKITFSSDLGTGSANGGTYHAISFALNPLSDTGRMDSDLSSEFILSPTVELTSITICGRPGKNENKMRLAIVDASTYEVIALNSNGAQTYSAAAGSDPVDTPITFTFNNAVLSTVNSATEPQRYIGLFVVHSNTLDTVLTVGSTYDVNSASYDTYGFQFAAKGANYSTTSALDWSFANESGAVQSSDYVPYLTIETKSLPVPEPTTATLSLLALAGLAARRRRK